MTELDPLSQLFRAFSHPHRRVALYYLDEHDEASLASLAKCLAGWTQSGPRTESAAVDVDDIRLQFHHQHLPTLTASGLVDYDADERTVKFRGLPDGGDEILAMALDADTGAAPGAEAESEDVTSLTPGVSDADGR